jgi:hypothetical protein
VWAYCLIARRAVEWAKNDQPGSFARFAFPGFPAATTLEPDMIVLIDVGVRWGIGFMPLLVQIKLPLSQIDFLHCLLILLLKVVVEGDMLVDCQRLTASVAGNELKLGVG